MVTLASRQNELLKKLYPLVEEALRHGAKITSIEPVILPTGLVYTSISDRYDRKVEVIVGVEDVRIKRQGFGGGTKKKGSRGNITGLSRKSRQRLTYTARNLESGAITTMLTLTYPGEYPTDGLKVKRDHAAMRKWLTRRGIGGLWVLEFQERGAPHFHAFLTGPVDKDEISKQWYRIVGSNDERHLRAGTRIERIRKPHAVAVYVSKYCAKSQQKEVPVEYQSVGRFWGLFGGLKAKEEIVAVGTIRELATFVRTLRRGYEAKRRTWRNSKKWKDGGEKGFMAWGMGALARVLIHQGEYGIGVSESNKSDRITKSMARNITDRMERETFTITKRALQIPFSYSRKM